MQPCVPYSNYHDEQTKREEAPVLHTHQGPIRVEFHLILQQPRAIRFRCTATSNSDIRDVVLHSNEFIAVPFYSYYQTPISLLLKTFFDIIITLLVLFYSLICIFLLRCLMPSASLTYHVSTWNREDMEIHIQIDVTPMEYRIYFRGNRITHPTLDTSPPSEDDQYAQARPYAN